MLISDIMNGIEYEGSFTDCEVRDVVIDSRRVGKGSVFVCVKGRSFDGHLAAQKALEAGAVALITERRLGFDNELVVADTRVVNAKLCQNFFGNPQKKLRLVAVTGTNGKTTIASLVKQMLELLGEKSGLIGTIRCEIGDMIIPAKFTTPEPWDLNALFAKMVDAGCRYAVMEASSQALAQQRLSCQLFDAAIFTNLTQDHLDYHGTMEEYYKAKRELFFSAKTAIINIDDAYGRRLAGEVSCDKIAFSVSDDSADYTAKSIAYSVDCVKFAVNSDSFLERTSLRMPGAFSVSNAMAALCTVFSLGFDRSQACLALSQVSGVIGRSEVLHSGNGTIICDFAHTADALANVLSSIKPFVKGRMLVLYGCAGDRDRTKRPAMTEAVCKYADLIILSSDNPRTEDPLGIIDEVQPILAASGIPFRAIPDRLEAIRWALSQLRESDVLMLCGKGHEDYQVIDGCTIYLDEHQIVREYYGE